MSQVSYTLSLYLHLHPPPQLSATVCTCLPLEGGQASFSTVYNCHNTQTEVVRLHIPVLTPHTWHTCTDCTHQMVRGIDRQVVRWSGGQTVRWCIFLHFLAYSCILERIERIERILAYPCLFLRIIAYSCVFLQILAYLCVFEHI